MGARKLHDRAEVSGVPHFGAIAMRAPIPVGLGEVLARRQV